MKLAHREIKTILILTVTASLFSCGNQGSQFKTDVAIPVSVEEVTKKTIRQIYQTSGVVVAGQEAVRKSEISADYQLQINQRTGHLFKMGDFVKRNEIIILLNDREYENTVNLEGAKLDYDISEMEFQKQQALYEKGGVTKRELVNSEKALISAKKNYENAIISMEKITIKAPFDGIITSLNYFSQGLRIEIGTELIGLMDYKKLVLDLSFPENMLIDIKTGQNVDIMNYIAVTDTLKGIISELSPAIDRNTRTFQGRVTINNRDEILKPGMFVRCEIETQKKDSAIVINKDLILTEGNQKIVYIAERETAMRRIVHTGLENKDEIEIIEGLNTGERLIVKGYETLTHRSKIKIIN